MKSLIFTLALTLTIPASGLEVIQSSPNAGETLKAPPRSFVVTFDAAPAPDTSVEIVGPQGRLTLRGVHAMGPTTLMGMIEGSAPDGAYALRWRSGDAQGEVTFTLKRPPDFVEDEWTPPLDIGVIVYDGTEPLDLFGPLEMWMNAGPDNIRVHLIAEEKRPVVLTTTGYPTSLAPTVNPQFTFVDAPELDVIMVPGGVGTLVEVDNPRLLDFLRDRMAEVSVMTSVCTGSGILAKAGLLKDVEATGNKVFFDYLVRQGPANWQPEARWVESGRFFTSSGVSAGIDMSLAVIARFFGIDAARMIATSTEYVWNEDPDNDPFVEHLNSAVPFVDALKARFEQQARSD